MQPLKFPVLPLAQLALAPMGLQARCLPCPVRRHDRLLPATPGPWGGVPPLVAQSQHPATILPAKLPPELRPVASPEQVLARPPAHPAYCHWRVLAARMYMAPSMAHSQGCLPNSPTRPVVAAQMTTPAPPALLEQGAAPRPEWLAERWHHQAVQPAWRLARQMYPLPEQPATLLASRTLLVELRQ